MSTTKKTAAYLAGVRAGLAAAARACMLVELRLRKDGNSDGGQAARDCALAIAEVKPGGVSEPGPNWPVEWVAAAKGAP